MAHILLKCKIKKKLSKGGNPSQTKMPDLRYLWLIQDGEREGAEVSKIHKHSQVKSITCKNTGWDSFIMFMQFK